MEEVEYKKLNLEHELAKTAASEARGVRQTQLARLKEEFNLPDVKAARDRLKVLGREIKTLEADFTQKLEAYKKEHLK